MDGKTYPSFLGQPGAANPMMGDTMQGPHQDPAFSQGGAPAGRFFGSELPVRAIEGGAPAVLGGFRASPETAPLPPPGSSVGSPKPPR
jgi:hypothetical protein